jgi:hypothetical protein
MAYDSLKALIRQYIKTNGEQEITGQILQNVLVEMVNQYPSTDGYATQSWVTSQGYLIPGSRISLLGNDVGYLTSADLSGYATTSQLAGYLPLTGGTMTGDLNMAYSSKLNFGTSYINEYTIPGPQGTNMGHILEFEGVDGYGYYNFDNSVHATSFIKENGTSAQFLKADGSVDENTYLPVVNGTISVSSGDMDIYSAGQQGGMATVFEAKDSQDVVFMGSQSYLFDGEVHASAFVKTNGISDEVLCADGSVKTLSELKAALDAL